MRACAAGGAQAPHGPSHSWEAAGAGSGHSAVCHSGMRDPEGVSGYSAGRASEQPATPAPKCPRTQVYTAEASRAWPILAG